MGMLMRKLRNGKAESDWAAQDKWWTGVTLAEEWLEWAEQRKRVKNKKIKHGVSEESAKI